MFESALSGEVGRKIEVPELPRKIGIGSKRCHVNKVNRSKLKCNHFIGSKTFVAARAEMGDTISKGVEPDRIEFYKNTHYSSENG
ncbi:hypothetical protein KY290_010791 [Solanum tuberosum]|uniref:Uncharacterized protein n=1 Tax=Solanum tuberosum TaxID=4113 RepID=A0ABQ7W0X2_SOLTU|nr:hypothetical protein KY290_010791 [Solanum tuberosum]